MARKQVFDKFLGVQTALDQRLTSKRYATKARDIFSKNGVMSLRSGFDGLQESAISGWTDCHGMYFVRGINAAGTVFDEYVCFEQVSGSTRAYQRTTADGTPTVLTKPAAATLNLNGSEWGAFVWRDKAYFFNENDTASPVVEYTIGDVDSLAVIKRPAPPGSADALTHTITYPKDNLSWPNAAGGDFSGDGAFSSVGNIQSFTFDITTNNTGPVSFTFDWGAATDVGNQDYEYSDVFVFFGVYKEDPATHGYRVNWEEFTFTLINVAGTSFPLEVVDVETQSDGRKWFLRFASSRDRSLTDDIKKLKVEYRVTTQSGTPPTYDVLVFGAWIEGGCDINGADPDYDYLDISYAYKDNSAGTVSQIGPALRLPVATLLGWPVFSGGNLYLGYRLVITAKESTETDVDRWVVYASFIPAGFDSGTVRGDFGTYVDSGGDLVQTWGVSFLEYVGTDKYGDELKVNMALDGITCAAVYKNWVILGMRGGGGAIEDIDEEYVGNIRHSWQNKPLFYAWPGQDQLNPARGVNWTLGAFGSDDPVQIVVSGDHVYITGDRAVYAQVGADTPSLMSPPIALPNSQGTAGRYACVSYTNEGGLTGVVYLGKDFDTLWFVWIASTFQSRGEHRLTKLSDWVPGEIYDHLFSNTDPSDTDKIQLYFDNREDCLILQYENKKALYRKQSLIDGERQWEFYGYELGSDTWFRTAIHLDYSIRHIRSDGKFDESEYDQSDDFALFGGNDRDNGSPIPSTGRYWISADPSGEPARGGEVYVEKQTKTDVIHVTMLAADGSEIETVQLGKNKEYARFSPHAQGPSRRYKFQLPDGSGDILRAEVLEEYAPRRR